MEWFSGTITEAISTAHSKGAYFVVHVKGQDGDENSQKFASILASPAVSTHLDSQHFVKIQLTVGTTECTQFSQIYPIVVVPSLYVIDQQGTPVEVIAGNVGAEELRDRVSKLAASKSVSQQAPAAASAATSSALPEAKSPADASTRQSSASLEAESSTALPGTPEKQTGEAASIPVTNDPKPEAGTSPAALAGSVEEQIIVEDASETDRNLTLEEKIEKAKMLQEAIRLNKEKEAKEKERKEEIERRETLKALQKFKQDQEEREMKEVAAQRRKEKEADRLAREKVKKQIEQDRLDKAARFSTVKASEVAAQKAEESQRTAQQQAKVAADAAARSQSARIQFRYPDGSSMTETFPADTAFADVRRFVEQKGNLPFRNFRLTTTFPRREFGSEESAKSLRDLELVPSAAILIIPADSLVRSGGGFSVTSLLQVVLTPFLAVLGYIRLFLFGTPIERPPTTSPPAAKKPKNNQSENGASTSKSVEGADQDGNLRRRNPKPASTFRREGNIHRLVDQPDEDSDDSNTWNGNSTQQQ